MYTCLEHLGGTGRGASLVTPVAYLTGTSAGGGAAGPSVEWESSAYTESWFMVSGGCGTIQLATDIIIITLQLLSPVTGPHPLVWCHY